VIGTNHVGTAALGRLAERMLGSLTAESDRGGSGAALKSSRTSSHKRRDTSSCARRTAEGGCPHIDSHYFPANSFFTISLTTLPSTRMPAALNLAIAFFITVPISFMVGAPISAIAAFTPATTSASPAALGR
jgi:hypothetical protein